ncbi:MAG TPA: response regulator [Gemmataceae bacterium]|nr:response regulator [Gemmataceae bacterium]
MIGASILVAEDDVPSAVSLQHRLEDMGLRVAAVASGEEAVRAAERLTPDLVLMDIRLPGVLDGIDAAARIRDRFDVPVVYLAAHPDDATLARARRTTPSGFLLQPVAERDLRFTVEMALHKHFLEKRLRESEGKLATTLDSIGDAVIATDADGRVSFMNPVAESLTGWRREEAYGLPLKSVFRTVEQPPRDGAEGQLPGLFKHTRLMSRQGVESPIDNRATPVRDARGKIRGAVLVFRDVSERVKAEESLRRAEEELRQAQKMEAVGRLAGGVAHDINNMMTIVMGYGETAVAQMKPDDPLRGMVEEMRRAGERSAAITRQLLAFCRKQLLNPVVVNLGTVVAGAEKLLRRLIGEDVQLVSVCAPDVGCVKADPGQLEQILLNLAINARDAMPQGGKLSIEVRNADLEEACPPQSAPGQPGAYLLLAVSDTGCGMNEATRARAFEPFFTTKEEGRGTGLGLATVYGIVKQSGGHIYVHSEPGRGTTFKIYLPRVSASGNFSPAQAPAGAPRGHETVMLVEDDDGVRALTRAILRQYGYTVLEAANGPEALRQCRERAEPVHLLLTDAIMPHMSGRILAERLTAQSPTTRVLFMSGYTEDSVLRHGVQAAQVPFIQKPFTAHALALKVREALDR